MEIEIYACGTHVTAVLGDVKGMITQQSIRFDRVSYEITYFDSGDFKTTWMSELEFRAREGAKKQVVGFKQF